MRNKRNYKTWAELSVVQKKQVSNHSNDLKNCKYKSRPLMKYNIDDKGDFNGEYIDAYLLVDMFSI